MPKTNEMLLKLEGFQHATSLDLNVGYYNIQMSENTSNLYTIILPWGKCWYKRLPMAVEISTEIFQQNMNDLFRGFDFICAYIYDLVVLTKGNWIDYVQKLELTLNKLK